MISPYSSARVAASDERLGGGDQLRAALELRGRGETPALYPLAEERPAPQHTGDQGESCQSNNTLTTFLFCVAQLKSQVAHSCEYKCTADQCAIYNIILG